jgi:signal transduction histidine kinase
VKFVSATRTRPEGRSTARYLWLAIPSVIAVVAVNAAGIWGIAVARRGVIEESEKVFRLEISARARALESALSSTRADLAFLAGSPAFFRLEEGLASKDPREARWRRLGAEGAILLFLRGHPEISHLRVLSTQEISLVEAGRRGGVPVLWMASRDAPASSREASGPQERPRISGRFTFTSGPPPERENVRLEAEIDASILVGHGRSPEGAASECALLDGGGVTLATENAKAAATEIRDPAVFATESPIATEGWSAPSPWRLRCARTREPAEALLDPLASRYRLTLILNLAVMALAFLLGSFAIHQARRRESLELRAQEEARTRELERQLFHAERLSTVGRLAAGIAHEINNPLEGMSNYLGLAREDLARGDADSARKRLDGVKEGLERAAAIVRQVLAHADPATAPKNLLDLHPVISQSVEFVRTRPEFGAIRFEIDQEEGPLEVRGSATMLGQVFLNLVLNACEAQPRGGEVTVRTRREAGRAKVEIADRGPGVPPEDAARIFEPFYSTKQSTGLGLSICHSIVRQHGGGMSVAARESGGTVFLIEFPPGEPSDG